MNVCLTPFPLFRALLTLTTSPARMELPTIKGGAPWGAGNRYAQFVWMVKKRDINRENAPLPCTERRG